MLIPTRTITHDPIPPATIAGPRSPSTLTDKSLRLLRRAPLVRCELPHLDARHLHPPLLLPRRIPRATCFPETLRSVVIAVEPRLARFVVLEPPVCGPDADSQDEVELLVEWRGVRAILPGVDEAGTRQGKG
jgi:hypothetical protein